MTYNTRELSVYDGEPFELYLFETETKSWRMTSYGAEMTYRGAIYETAAIHRTATSYGQELKSGTIKLTLPKDHPLAGEFISFIPSTPMTLVIYRGHVGEAEDQVVTHFTGNVSSAMFTDVCELTAIPDSDVLKRRIPGPKYQKQCNHMLYDAGCTIDKTLFLTVATLTSVVGDTIQAAEFADQVDGWFNAGYIEKNTERRMIISHVGNTVVLLNPMAVLAVGDVVNAYAGCNRDSATCATKFDNIIHHFGFKGVPDRNPFEGGLN